jgi:hypothetical protein
MPMHIIAKKKHHNYSKDTQIHLFQNPGNVVASIISYQCGIFSNSKKMAKHALLIEIQSHPV